MSAYAIVGLACLFPGAQSPDQFWDNLMAGRDSRRTAGPEVFGLDPEDRLVTDPEHPILTTRGGFLDADADADVDSDGAPDAVVAWPLRVARDAVADAGLAAGDPALARTGVVLGNYTFPTRSSSAAVLPWLSEAVLRGLREAGVPLPVGEQPAAPDPDVLAVGGLPALRLARELGLGGPRLALDAACSSTLYAVRLACDYLAAGAADLMVAGGVCAPDPALIHLSFSDLQAYSRNGISQPFDAASGGILTGQGAGAIALKRLADAVRDGDRIHAVIEGVGLSNDGTGRHLLAPNPRGQLETYRLAYAGAGVDPEQVDYIECHATGTPLGDGTELAALQQWYEGRSHRPRIGSVKGNVGHLLTVAGLTSLLKTVLAMRHGVIPPTIGVSTPLASPDGTLGGDGLVRAATAWPRRGVRRAGVSAFGFGGTNAHAILRAPLAEEAPDTAAGPPPAAIAITGIGVHAGGLGDAAALDDAVRAGAADERPVPGDRWYGVRDATGPAGAYLESFEVEASRFQIPPKELGHFNEQHLLMLRVAEQALLDDGLHTPEEGLRRPDRPARRVAVLIATEMEPRTHAHRARLGIGRTVADRLDDAGLLTDPGQRDAVVTAARRSLHDPVAPNEVLSYIGNIMASRISARWNLTGPSFTVAGDSAAAANALDVAALLLRDETIEAVLVGAVGLAGGTEAVLARFGPDGADLPEGSVRRPGDGAAAIVLRRAADRPDGAHPTLAGLAVRHAAEGEPDGVAVDAAARTALAAAGATGRDVGLLQTHEALAGADDHAAGQLPWLAGAYPAQGDPTCAVGRVAEVIGDPGVAGGLAAVVAAVLALRHRYLPVARPDRGAAPADSAFYLPGGTGAWLREEGQERRLAAVALRGDHGTAAHLVLAADAAAPRPATTVPGTRWRRAGAPFLLPVGAPAGRLAEALAAVRERLVAGADPGELGLAALGPDGPAPGDGDTLRAVLVGPTSDALVAELDRLARDLPELLAGRGQRPDVTEWATPAGSYLALQPLGTAGKVALVYPGAFNSYLGLGQDLPELFPSLLDRVEARSPDTAHALRDRLVRPRSRTPLARRDLVRLEDRLLGDMPAMLSTSTSHALMVTDLLRGVLGLPVAGALGYSLGESSMLRSLGAWGPDPVTDRRIDTTPVFVDRLCGARTTVRQRWALGPDVPDRQVWASQVLMAPAEEVRRLVGEYDRLFLTHVNTPGEVVVAGAPAQLKHLVERLGCPAARVPGEHVMHCEVVDPDLDELAALNTYPADQHPPGPGPLDLFTAGTYARIESFDSAGLAANIAGTLRGCIDFPRLVGAAHDAGYRCFVEVGPGGTCTRWITEILRGRPHLAVTADRRGWSGATSVAHLAARLLSHGQPVRLDALLAPEPAPAGRSLAVTVRCGGESIAGRMRAAVESLDLALDLAPATIPTRPATEASPTMTPQPGTTPPEPLPLIDLAAADLTATHLAAPAPTVPATAAPEPAAVPVATGGAGTGEPTRSVVTFRGTPLAAVLDRRPDSRPAAPEPRPAAEPRRALAPLAALPPLTAPGGAGIASWLPEPPAGPGPDRDRTRPEGVVWDEQDLLTFATGRIADVFGPDFADIDDLPKRVRLPEPPYLLASRVTQLDATPGRLEPARLTSELDVPPDAWFLLDGLVPAAVTIEAGQCDMLLISYLGIDRHNRGERVYRLLDSTLTFHGDLPLAGQKLRYDISIDRFVSHGEVRIFFFSYRCYADDQLILELSDACAGFFTQAELDASAGIVTPRLARDQAVERRTFKPLLRTPVTSLGPVEMAALGAGRIADVFGPEYDQQGLNPSLRLPDERLRMIDEITRLDRTGGAHGLGALSAVKYLDPAGWYFRCHFTDDPVLAGSLVAEGAVQILQAFVLSLGLQTVLPDARFQTVPGLRTQVKVRGQITPKTPSIRYEVEVTEVTLLPRPTVIADITVYDGERAVISMRNFGMQLREKPGTPYRPDAGGRSRNVARRNAAGEVAIINELHLAHAAKGDLGTAMGPEFDVYGQRRAPHIPNGAFQFVDRIMALEGTRGVLKAGAVMETEYDSPPEAWYYRDNTSPSMPNAVLLETSLQAAILLGYYLGATLDSPETEYSIRNLDGRATILRDVDLRGRTIRQRTTLLNHSAMPGTVLQNFRYELSTDGEPFYRGESLFGYFAPEALATQVGLDNGQFVPPWIAGQSVTPRRIDLTTDPSWFLDGSGGGMHLPDGRLRLLDWADLVSGGGKAGLGYVHGHRRVTPEDWYFACHFHRDPVMPGSLGVESVLEGLQLFALAEELHAGLEAPRFALARDVPVRWRYRGQILRDDPELQYEIHVTDIRRSPGRVVVVADASLYKPGLRIYELSGLAVEIVGAQR